MPASLLLDDNSDTDVGPYAPSGIYFTDVTSDSVTLHWTSGYDFGHQQHFVIMRWEGNTFIQVNDLHNFSEALIGRCAVKELNVGAAV